MLNFGEISALQYCTGNFLGSDLKGGPPTCRGPAQIWDEIDKHTGVLNTLCCNCGGGALTVWVWVRGNSTPEECVFKGSRTEGRRRGWRGGLPFLQRGLLFGFEISPAICRVQKPRKPEKSQKSLPRGVWDPLIPDPEKIKKKVRKVKKIVDFQTFSWLFGLFQGPEWGGPKLLSGDFFETFRVFGVLDSVDSRGDLNFGCSQEIAKFQPYCYVYIMRSLTMV